MKQDIFRKTFQQLEINFALSYISELLLLCIV